jgi:hypothetical protein
VVLRASGLPGVVSFEYVRWRGKEGTLKEDGTSESVPDEGALETGVGLRMVKETFEEVMVVNDKGYRYYVIIVNPLAPN